MSSLFDRIRSGAGRAAFEADKARRITSVQSTIRSLKDEINQAFFRAGQVAYEAYRQGQVTQPELLQACERLRSLQEQMMAREQEIEVIRNEEFREPARQSQYGYLCPNGHGELPSGAMFCPACGSEAIHIPPPSPDEMSVSCSACGAKLGPEARFCPACGSAASPPAPVPSPEVPPQELEDTPVASPPPAGRHCPQCGSELVSGAAFCPDCGHHVQDGGVDSSSDL